MSALLYHMWINKCILNRIFVLPQFLAFLVTPLAIYLKLLIIKRGNFFPKYSQKTLHSLTVRVTYGHVLWAPILNHIQPLSLSGYNVLSCCNTFVLTRFHWRWIPFYHCLRYLNIKCNNRTQIRHWLHKGHPISHPNWWAMGYLLWAVWRELNLSEQDCSVMMCWWFFGNTVECHNAVQYYMILHK